LKRLSTYYTLSPSHFLFNHAKKRYFARSIYCFPISHEHQITSRINITKPLKMLLSLVLPLLSFAASITADLILAPQPRYASSHLDTRQSDNPLLGKRQFCSSAYPYSCSAVNGDTMCMAAAEVCCQRIAIDGSGTYPYVCPRSHPYCCPSDRAGNPLCGSDSSCKSSSSDVQDHGAATQTKSNEKNGGTGRRVEGVVLMAAVLGGLVIN
jgi:hypothetical protein